MSTIELLVRGRFVALPGAIATKLAANAWEIAVPISPAVQRWVRDAQNPEAWDGQIFALDGRETEPAVGAGGTRDEVKVTVLLF